MAGRNPASDNAREQREPTSQERQQTQGTEQVEQFHPSERGAQGQQGAASQERSRQSTQGQQAQQQAATTGQRQQYDQDQQREGGTSGRTAQQRGAGVTGDRERQVQTSRESGGQQRGVARQQQQQPMTESEDFLTPFAFMRRFLEDTDQLFHQFGSGAPSLGLLAPSSGRGLTPGRGAGRSFWSPQVEISRQGNNLVVCADLPGLNKDDIDVNVEDGVLTIEGERRNETENTREGYYTTERSYGTFYRAIPLPEGVTGDQAEATFNNGVLEVKLPIPQEEQQRGRKIAVK